MIFAGKFEVSHVHTTFLLAVLVCLMRQAKMRRASGGKGW